MQNSSLSTLLPTEVLHLNKIYFGLAGNPPHKGHWNAVSQMLNKFPDCVVVMCPSYKHPFGKELPSFEERLNWLSVSKDTWLPKEYSNRVIICRIEEILSKSLPNEKPVYSFNVLSALQSLGGGDVKLAVGEDNLTNLPKFFRYEDIRDKFGIVVMDEQVALHSSSIRPLLEKLKNSTATLADFDLVESAIGSQLTTQITKVKRSQLEGAIEFASKRVKI